LKHTFQIPQTVTLALKFDGRYPCSENKLKGDITLKGSVSYLVVTSAKYHETRVRAVMSSWGADVADRLVFLSDATSPYYPQVIDLGVGDDYESATTKAIIGVKDISLTRYPDSDWIFMCDDDTLVFVDYLEDFLASQNPRKNICFGQLLKLSPELTEFNYPSGGAGYALSRTACSLLRPLLADCKLLHWSDVTIGLCLMQAGTDLIDLPGLHLSPPNQIDRNRIVRKSGRNRTHPLTFHWLQPDEMVRLYKLKGTL
jgi:hypothetical protein